MISMFNIQRALHLANIKVTNSIDAFLVKFETQDLENRKQALHCTAKVVECCGMLYVEM